MTCTAWPMTCWTPPEDAALAALVWDAACDVVWAATGRRVGICTFKTWVSLTGAGDSCLPYPVHDGVWMNVYAGSPDCCRITLPAPVEAVSLVQIDGVAFTGYTVIGDTLVTNNGGCWPAERFGCHPRIYIEWTGGNPVPTYCLFAAAEVADEFVKACADEPSCRLPSNVISVVRQGITQQFVDPSVLIDAGLWGLPRLDAAVRTLNPHRLAQRALVLSPDSPRFRSA